MTKRKPSGLIVYGANCAWFDVAEKAGRVGNVGIPCCPVCGSVLFQVEAGKWWKGAETHERNGNPGYVAMLKWAQGKCFPNIKAVTAAYRAQSQLSHNE